MSAKTEQLQIRVTVRQKAAIKAAARAAGCDVSTYVLARVAPERNDRFAEILDSVRGDAEPRFALAELNDFLAGAPPVEYSSTVREARLDGLSPYLRNYIAAMVEQAAYAKRVPAPAWTMTVAPLDAPHFVTPMKSLRTHLLLATPVPFKRRNIFIDASVGARV